MKVFLKVLCIVFLFLTIGCISVEKDALYTPETVFYILSNNPLNRITVRDDEIIKGIEEALKENDLKYSIIENKNEIIGLRPTSYGSGFAIAPDVVITNCHVIRNENGRKITVKSGDKTMAASLLYIDKSLDIAVLKLSEEIQYYFDVEKSENNSSGEHITVLGYPMPDVLGDDVKVTDGIISSTNLPKVIPSIQISAPIQPGNSGGPVINDEFKIVGVAYSSLNDVYFLGKKGIVPQNVNFAIKTDVIFKYAGDYIKKTDKCVSDLNEAFLATVQVISEDVLEDDPKQVLIEYVGGMGVIIASFKVNLTFTDVYTNKVVGNAGVETEDYHITSRTLTRRLLDKLKLVKVGNPTGLRNSDGEDILKE